MIKNTAIIAFFLLAIFTGGVLFQAFYSLEQGGSIEEMLTQEISIPKHEEKFPNEQIRTGVTKDLWMSDKEMVRLHHHIESPRSVLTAIPDGSHFKLVEQMIGMKCYFQEKLEEEGGELMQQIRYLQSEEGTYQYTDHFFNTKAVFLALYRLPGKTLLTDLSDNKAYLEGVAEGVSLSLSNGSPNFHAKKFKAEIHPQGKTP